MNDVVKKGASGVCAALFLWGWSHCLSLSLAWAGQAEGKRIYVAHCLSCHGLKGDGKGPKGGYLTPAPPDFTEPAYWQDKTDSYLFHVVQNGMGSMPGWSDRLSPDNIEKVLSYIRSFRR